MKLLLVVMLASFSFGAASAEKPTFVDSIHFVQYLDENTALEEVRDGNLDLYYFRVPSERLEDSSSREDLKIFQSTGGSYSLLVNPAKTENLNPFSITEVRFALNYLIDRNLIVNELMGGFGIPMISNYGPFDPDYIHILDELESFHFQYNPVLADQIITDALQKEGAQKIDGRWMHQGEQIKIKIFIRSDDPVRKSIGEILSAELEKVGFSVSKDFGDLNKAFVVVYGSDPSDAKWHLYTEGWAGRSAFVKYDSVGLAQMYSPWFSNMPGFNNPSYWNYKNDYLDSVTQKIYTGNFDSAQKRIDLIKEATVEGIKESVRIFIASKIDHYVANPRIEGVVNDFGGGVPNRFTPINARADSDTIKIGVKQIYQGAWNPIGGLSDAYSKNIWDVLFDPGVFKHPYTGETFPIRTNWVVESAGPSGTLDVPDGVINWDPVTQQWETVKNKTAVSKITYNLLFSNWHNGQKMDINDILHSLYFVMEWGSEKQNDDKTFDSEYTPQASRVAETIVGVRIIDENTIEAYVNYWHFDEAEIADWGGLWTSMPWEITYAMEQAVLDGKSSFSRSGAASKNVNWLSLVVPNDAMMIKNYLEQFKETNTIPKPLREFIKNEEAVQSRYDSSIKWIEKTNHAIISNGPFYLQSYSPESRTITIKAFDDPSYPFEAGYWMDFENVKYPKITDIAVPQTVTLGEKLTIPIKTSDVTKIQYFLTSSDGINIISDTKNIVGDDTVIEFSGDVTRKLGIGASDLKVFAVSDAVLRPDIYTTSFLTFENTQQIPKNDFAELEETSSKQSHYVSIAAIVIGAIIVGVVYSKRRQRKKSAQKH